MTVKKTAHIKGLEAKSGLDIVDEQADVEPVVQDKSLDLSDVYELEKFMQDTVKVLIWSTTDANATPYADISVNGIKAVVHRNVPTPIKRMHLEVLARMKETRWVQNEIEAMKPVGLESLRGHSALVYPFTVVEDPNPKGGAWLQHILQEPA